MRGPGGAAAPSRTAMDILRELHGITVRMKEQRTDADFLIEGVSTRQKLLDEYAKLEAKAEGKPYAESDRPEVQSIIKEIKAIDKVINQALRDFQQEAKDDLAKNQQQQKVLGYLNNLSNGAGSIRMDYRK